MTEQEVIASFFELRPEYAVQANISFLRERAAKPLTVDGLSAAADQLRDTLLLSPAYESAWQEFLFYTPDRKKNTAERNLFIQSLREKEIQAAASQEYEALIKQLGEKWRGNSIDRLREVVEKRRVHNLTASQFLAEQPKKPTVRQYDGYPTLPEFLVLPGDIQATKIDGAFLSKIVRTDYFLYRRLYNKFGGQQLTDRQNGIMKGAAQPLGE